MFIQVFCRVSYKITQNMHRIEHFAFHFDEFQTNVTFCVETYFAKTIKKSILYYLFSEITV